MKHKNKTLILLVLVMFFLTMKFLYPELPTSINYQGRYFVNAEPFTGTKSNCYFKITNADGSAVYFSTGPLTIQFRNGLFNWQIPCSTVPWNNPPSGGYYIETVIDGVSIGREKILAVPYAFFASSASYAAASAVGGGWADDGSVVRLADPLDNVGIGTTSPQAKLHVEGDTQFGTATASTFSASGFVDLADLTSDPVSGGPGSIAYRADTKKLRVKTDVGWVDIATGTISSTAISGTGTTNTVAKFISANTIGSSTITDDGTNVSILGDLKVGGNDIKDSDDNIRITMAPTGDNVTLVGQTRVAGQLIVTGSATVQCAAGLAVTYGITAGTLTLTGNTIFPAASTITIAGNLRLGPSATIYNVAGSTKVWFDGEHIRFYSGPTGWLVFHDKNRNEVFKVDGTASPGATYVYNNFSVHDPAPAYTQRFKVWGGGGVRVGVTDSNPGANNLAIDGNIAGIGGGNIYGSNANNLTLYGGTGGYGIDSYIKLESSSTTNGNDIEVVLRSPGNKFEIMQYGAPWRRVARFYSGGGVRIGNTDANPGLDSLAVDGQLIVVGSATVQGAGGLGVTYGIRAGTLTLTGNQIFDSAGNTRITMAPTGDNVTLAGQTKVSGQLIVVGSATVQGAGGLGVTYGIRAGTLTLTSPHIFTTVTGPADNIILSSHTKVDGQLIVTGSVTIRGAGGLSVNNGIILFGAQDIKNHTTNSRTLVAGGTAWDQGGFIQIFGKDATGDAGPGGVQIQLWNTSDSKFEIFSFDNWTRRFRVWGMGGVRVGSTNVDPGPNNLAVDGQLIVGGSCTVRGTALEVGSGSGGGDAIRIVNGGDLRIFTPDNTGSAVLYCDVNNVLRTSGYFRGQNIMAVIPMVCTQKDDTRIWKNNTEYEVWPFSDAPIRGTDYAPNGEIQIKLVVQVDANSPATYWFRLMRGSVEIWAWEYYHGSGGSFFCDWDWVTPAPWTGLENVTLQVRTTDNTKFYYVNKAYLLIRTAY